jgi:hypothetical protein
MGRPLKIAKAQAVLTITATNATTEQVTVSQTLANEGVIAGMPFVTASSVGGLTAGTTYWILELTGASTFTVSATPLNANPTSTPVNLSGTTGQSVITTVGLVDSGFQNPDSTQQSGGTSTNPGASYGVVGGNTTIYGNQVVCQVAIGVTGTGTISASDSSTTVTGVGTSFTTELSVGSSLAAADGTVLGFVDSITDDEELELVDDALASVTDVGFSYANDETGYIVRQKGKQKYLVKGLTSGLVGACYTANVANTALTPNTLNIIATYANSSTAFVQSLSDYNMEIFGGDDTLPNSNPAYATFNTAYAANTYGGQPYPIVTINKA